MATPEMQKLLKERAKAISMGKKNKVATLDAQIKAQKQSQKAARGEGASMSDVVDSATDAANTSAGVSNELLGSVPKTYNISQFNDLLPTFDQGAYDSAWEAAYSGATRGVSEKREEIEAATRQRLADQGIPLGSKLYDSEFKRISDEYNAIDSNARNDATLTAENVAANRFNLGKSAYDSAVGQYNMQFDKPIEFGNALSGITASNYAIAAQDRQFQQDAKQFGQSVALERWKTRQVVSARGGGGGGGGADTSPIVAGNGFNI